MRRLWYKEKRSRKIQNIYKKVVCLVLTGALPSAQLTVSSTAILPTLVL